MPTLAPNPQPNVQAAQALLALQAELAKREAALQAETDPDLREALENKIAKLRAELARSGPPTIYGDVVGGDKVGRDKIGTQITYVNGQPIANENALRDAYLGRLLEKANQVRIVGSDDWAERVKLANIYTALLTDRSKNPEKGGRAAMAQLGQNEREQDLLSAVAMLNRERKMVLLGGPGSGKSTFANYVLMCLAGQILGRHDVNFEALTRNEAQPWQHGNLIPIFIELREFAAQLPTPNEPIAEDCLWQFIAGRIVPNGYAPYLEKALLNGQVLVLLDGLDEVPDAYQRREQVKTAVQAFVGLYGKCRFLVTSRTYAYQQQKWRLDGFVEAGLRPLSAAQIEHFVTAWYAHMASDTVARLSASDAEGKAAQLQQRLTIDPKLADLAKRPLLLTLIARLHMLKSGSLPSGREKIYEQSVMLLLEDWEKQRLRKRADGSFEVTQISISEYLKLGDVNALLKVLQKLAYAAHADPTQADQSQPANITGKALSDALLDLCRDHMDQNLNSLQLENYLSQRSGILVSHGNGMYQFPHRTFQEYLAARYLIEETVDGLEYPTQLAKLVKRDVNRWREATQLAAARQVESSPLGFWALIEELSNPSQGVNEYDDVWGALMAGQALLDNERGKPGTLQGANAKKAAQVQVWMRRIVEQGLLSPADRLIAGNALAWLGDDRPGVGGIQTSSLPVPDIAWVKISAGEFIYGEEKDFLGQGKKLRLPDFYISKYLITYAQFQCFIDAPDGWANPTWWQGLAATAEHRAQAGEQRWPIANRPRERVSWLDAMAFCRWLSQRLGFEVTLPTEQQWERAARETKGLVYPWGNDYKVGFANIDEQENKVGPNYLRSTSAVGMYPQGASSEGVLDMCGNVWEWCLNEYSNPKNIQAEGDKNRVVRGGSWSDSGSSARAAFRNNNPVVIRDFSSGFRLVSSAPLFSARVSG